MKIEINNIDDLIQAYKAEKLTDRQLLKVVQAQNKKIMVFSDYNETITRAKNLESLKNYKRYLESECEFPIFWPFLNENPTEFSFNDTFKKK